VAFIASRNSSSLSLVFTQKREYDWPGGPKEEQSRTRTLWLSIISLNFGEVTPRDLSGWKKK